MTTDEHPAMEARSVDGTGTESRTPRASQAGAAAGGGAVYGLGLIGAIVYFIQFASSGWDYVLALPKAVFWPALLVYEAFEKLAG